MLVREGVVCSACLSVRLGRTTASAGLGLDISSYILALFLAIVSFRPLVCPGYIESDVRFWPFFCLDCPCALTILC